MARPWSPCAACRTSPSPGLPDGPRPPGCRVGGTSGLVRPWSAGGLRVTTALAHTETERPALDGERLGPVRPGTAHRTHLPGRGSVRVLRGIRNQICPFLGRGRGKGCVGPVVAGTLLGSGGHGLLCLDRRARWGRRDLRVTRPVPLLLLRPAQIGVAACLLPVL